MSLETKEKEKKLKRQIDTLDQNIASVDGEIKEIYTICDMLNSLKENLDVCSAIVYNALEPGEEKARFRNLLEENSESFKKSAIGFDERTDMLSKRKKSLIDERESLLDEYEKINDDDKREKNKA